MMSMTFHGKKNSHVLKLNRAEGEWLLQVLRAIAASESKVKTLSEIKTDFENHGLEHFEMFWHSAPMQTLRNLGLLQL